jgi:hypothetical protein
VSPVAVVSAVASAVAVVSVVVESLSSPQAARSKPATSAMLASGRMGLRMGNVLF